MAARNFPSSPPPQRPPPSSPALSATRPSPLASGTLRPYPVTASPFTSSPTFSFTQASRCTPSPDLFEDFTYTADMEADFNRIDSIPTTNITRAETPQVNADPPQQFSAVFPSLPRNRKTWVVFRGKVPGIYDYGKSAAFHTQGFSNAFQRTFPNRDSAEAAWSAFVRDGTYPDYGRGPWVVYHGQRPGVFTKVTELEASVKGYSGAIFRSCSSAGEGRIKFHLFAERVAQMFDGADPFSDADGLASKPEEVDRKQKAVSIPQPVTPVPVLPRLPLALRTPDPPRDVTSSGIAESSTSASNRNGKARSLYGRGPNVPRRVDGWYVAYHAVLPGVYCCVEALKAAGPEPGGFQCMLDKESADTLFHELTFSGRVLWASGDE